MADFTQTATVKTAVRELATPIDSIANFTALINDILTDNPWGCTSYEQARATLPGASKSSEPYTGRLPTRTPDQDRQDNQHQGSDAISLQYWCQPDRCHHRSEHHDGWHSVLWQLREPFQLHPQVSLLKRGDLLGPVCPWLSHALGIWGPPWPGLRLGLTQSLYSPDKHLAIPPFYLSEAWEWIGTM